MPKIMKKHKYIMRVYKEEIMTNKEKKFKRIFDQYSKHTTEGLLEEDLTKEYLQENYNLISSMINYIIGWYSKSRIESDKWTEAKEHLEKLGYINTFRPYLKKKKAIMEDI